MECCFKSACGMARSSCSREVSLKKLIKYLLVLPWLQTMVTLLCRTTNNLLMLVDSEEADSDSEDWSDLNLKSCSIFHNLDANSKRALLFLTLLQGTFHGPQATFKPSKKRIRSKVESWNPLSESRERETNPSFAPYGLYSVIRSTTSNLHRDYHHQSFCFASLTRLRVEMNTYRI